jgi:hypothetical protein
MSTTTICPVCTGSGTTYLEHDDGSLSQQPCPFCKGRKDAAWVAQAQRTRAQQVMARRVAFRLPVLVIYLIGLGVMAGRVPVGFLVFWGIGAVGIAMWVFSKPKPAKVRRPDPMTTDHERLVSGVLLTGLALKAWEMEHQHRNNQNRGR